MIQLTPSQSPLRKSVAILMLFAALVACRPDSLFSLQTGEHMQGDSLISISKDELEGTIWVLNSYGPVGEPVKALDAPAVTMEFTDNQRLHGMAGCNTYATSFEINGSLLALGELDRTPFGCPGETTWVQETAFFDALTTANSIVLDGDELVITYGGGKLRLVREEPRPTVSLGGKQWRLTAIRTDEGIQSPVPAMLITAEFADGEMTGSVGCNSYSGTYVTEGHSLAIVDTIMTIEDCVEQDAMIQEKTYMDALHAAKSYTVDDHTLYIAYDGGTLFFAAQSTSVETARTLQK